MDVSRLGLQNVVCSILRVLATVSRFFQNFIIRLFMVGGSVKIMVIII